MKEFSIWLCRSLWFSHDEVKLESFDRPWWCLQFGRDEFELARIWFGHNDPSDSGMIMPSQRVFYSAVAISLIWPWQPHRFGYDEAALESFDLAATISPIKLWRRQVGKSLIQLWQPLWFGLDDAKLESLRFDHEDLLDSVLIKPSRRGGLHPMASDRYNSMRHTNKRKSKNKALNKIRKDSRRERLVEWRRDFSIRFCWMERVLFLSILAEWRGIPPLFS